MTKKTIHTFNSISIRFTNQILVTWNNIVNWKFISSVKFSINMRNVCTKFFETFRTSVAHKKANKFFSHSIYSCPKPYYFFLKFIYISSSSKISTFSLFLGIFWIFEANCLTQLITDIWLTWISLSILLKSFT